MSTELAFDAAIMMMRAGKREQAAAVCWEILRQNPKHADAWAMRARVEADAGRYANAMIHHGFALQFAPQRFDLWINRGIDAMGAKMFKEAEQSFAESLCLQESFEGHYNYGKLLEAEMRIDEAIREYQAALGFDAEHMQARTNLGTALIAVGDWQNGFMHYRSRFNTPGFPPAPRLSYPQWLGEPLYGKTILLFAEQGFGDEIMSLRFRETVRNRGANEIILAVRPPVYRLARQKPYHTIVLYDEPPLKPDYQCALLDVPFFAGLTPETMPGKDGYLTAEDRGHKLQFPPGLNVGVCWSSGKRDLQPYFSEIARQKSLSFAQLVAPLARPGINLISLQQAHDDAAALREFGVHDPMPGVTDFADTAWIMSQLDLVITVDTSVAHLAGALGVPCFNLVRFDALWPWMQETGPTCWYDSMTVYRQQKPFDWSEPLKRLQADFANFGQAAAA